MDGRIVVAMVVLIAFVTAGRWIYESGRRHLSPEQKAQVSDSQVAVNKYSLVALFPVVLAAYFLPSLGPWLAFLYLVGWLGFAYRQLRPSRFPPSFRRAAAAHMSLYLLGAAVFLLVVYGGQAPS